MTPMCALCILQESSRNHSAQVREGLGWHTAGAVAAAAKIAILVF